MPRLNLRTPTAVATGLYDLGDAGYFGAAEFLVSIIGSASFSGTFRGVAVGGTVTTTSPQVQYRDLSAAGTTIAGATAITADGNVRVPAAGLDTGLHVTAGTATVTVVALGA